MICAVTASSKRAFTPSAKGLPLQPLSPNRLFTSLNSSLFCSKASKAPCLSVVFAAVVAKAWGAPWLSTARWRFIRDIFLPAASSPRAVSVFWQSAHLLSSTGLENLLFLSLPVQDFSSNFLSIDAIAQFSINWLILDAKIISKQCFSRERFRQHALLATAFEQIKDDVEEKREFSCGKKTLKNCTTCKVIAYSAL